MPSQLRLLDTTAPVKAPNVVSVLSVALAAATAQPVASLEVTRLVLASSTSSPSLLPSASYSTRGMLLGCSNSVSLPSDSSKVTSLTDTLSIVNSVTPPPLFISTVSVSSVATYAVVINPEVVDVPTVDALNINQCGASNYADYLNRNKIHLSDCYWNCLINSRIRS